MTNLESILKSRDITQPTKVHLVKAMVFPVVMYGYESWTIRKQRANNWCFWTVVLEKTLESPLDGKEIKAVHPKGNQSWIFIGRTDAEAPILWSPDVKNWLIWKDPDAGKIEGRRRKGRQRMRCWMASPTRWTWLWVNSGSWWWIGKSGMLQSMESQIVRHNWATELNWMALMFLNFEHLAVLVSCHWLCPAHNHPFLCCSPWRPKVLDAGTV